MWLIEPDPFIEDPEESKEMGTWHNLKHGSLVVAMCGVVKRPWWGSATENEGRTMYGGVLTHARCERCITVMAQARLAG